MKNGLTNNEVDNITNFIDACNDAKKRGLKNIHICLNSEGLYVPIESISVSELTGFVIYIDKWDKNYIGIK